MPLDQDETPLFVGFEPPETPEVDPKLSAGQRLTLRQSDRIAIGLHPLGSRALHPEASRNRDSTSPRTDPFTCGSCVFRVVQQHHNKTYPKCLSHGDKHVSSGPATDVRAWWPACTDYSAEEQGGA